MNIKRTTTYIFVLTILIVGILYAYHNYSDRSWGDAFSLGQLLVELILLPIAIASFIYATQQFLENQELPRPQLYFETSENNYSQTVKWAKNKHGPTSTPAIVLKNEGKSITSWYLVLLNISSDIYLDTQPLRSPLNVQPNVYDPHWETISVANGVQWRFTSQGEYALYPEYIQKLCTITFIFSDKKTYPVNCKIPYIIFSDRGKKVNGELRIEFI